MARENSGVMSNFLWRLAERFGAQGVAFVVSIVLARLLAPEAYGTIALVTVFTQILNVFIDSGFGGASHAAGALYRVGLSPHQAGQSAQGTASRRKA